MTDAKGKLCACCGAPMSNLASQFIRKCTNGKCGAAEPWPLEDKQKPLIASSRDRRQGKS